VNGFEEIEERALGIRAGDDGFGGDFFAGRERYASDSAVFDENARDFGVGANFSAGFARGCGESIGESSRTTFRLHVAAIRESTCAATKEKKRSSAGGPRASGGAENSASGGRGAEEFRLKKFGDEIGDGHRSPADKALHVFLVEAAECFSSPEEIPDVTRGGLINVRRRHKEEIADEGARRIESFGEFDVSGGVGLGELGDCGDVRKSAGAEEKGTAIGMGSEEARGGFEELNAVAFELHVLGDGGSKWAMDGIENGGAEARVKFFGDGSAADDRATLEDEGFVAGAGEIEGGNEGILAGADDDDVARSHCY
jgi:hypothetical protein